MIKGENQLPNVFIIIIIVVVIIVVVVAVIVMGMRSYCVAILLSLSSIDPAVHPDL